MEKQYKRYIPRSERRDKPVEGLGDVIKEVLIKTGIDGVYRKLAPTTNAVKKKCTPCEKREQKINESKVSKLIFGDKNK